MLTVGELSKLTGVGTASLKQWIDKGLLPPTTRMDRHGRPRGWHVGKERAKDLVSRVREIRKVGPKHVGYVLRAVPWPEWYQARNRARNLLRIAIGQTPPADMPELIHATNHIIDHGDGLDEEEPAHAPQPKNVTFTI